MSLNGALKKRIENEPGLFLQEEHKVQEFNYLEATEYNSKFVIEFKPTDNCNYKCSYCYFYETGAKGMQPEIFQGVLDMFKSESSDYTKKIKEFNEVFIFVYGGEPLLHKDTISYIIELNEIHPNCTFLIQSNGSVWKLDQYKEACDLLDVNGIKYNFSFSWHNEFIKAAEFIEIVQYLLQRGVFDVVVFMTTLATAAKDRKYIKMLHRVGIPVHVRTVLQESEAFRRSEFMDMITVEDEQPFKIHFEDGEKLLSFEELTTGGYLSFKGLECRAGIDSIQITPTGDVYRCDLDGLHASNKIANVLDTKIKLPVDLKCEHCFCSIYFSDKYKKGQEKEYGKKEN